MESSSRNKAKQNLLLMPLAGKANYNSLSSLLTTPDETSTCSRLSIFSSSENNLNSTNPFDIKYAIISNFMHTVSMPHEGTTTSPINSHALAKDLSDPIAEKLHHNYKTVKRTYLNILKSFLNKIETMNYHEKIIFLNKIYEIVQHSWSIPAYGQKIAISLCNYLYLSGGLSWLTGNLTQSDALLQFSSARVLEKCMSWQNTKYVVENRLQIVVELAINYTQHSDANYTRIGTGILGHLFKHNERTCYDVILLGGLDAVLLNCRINDLETLRNCARSLANLSLYGGAENQEAVISKKVPMWLFPLAFHNDDAVKYFACLAIAVLVANKEFEAEVLKSGTLDLVESFVTSHDPSIFAKSSVTTVAGKRMQWLERLVPVLNSNREEARNLAAFHFCMEALIKKEQGNTEMFREIKAIEPLKIVASSPNPIASKFAAQALRLIGEPIPHQLSQQVPLWTIEDVQEWVKQIGLGCFENKFAALLVDGDMLLRLTEENLAEDIGISNGILRMRFMRELQNLKKMADYSSKDCAHIYEFLNKINPNYCVYTYPMWNAGIGRSSLMLLDENTLINQCGIENSIHRRNILEASAWTKDFVLNEQEANTDKSLDVFVSYRRSTGSQLASLLKVHLQLRRFSVFLDVERLEAGAFDSNLLKHIQRARNFILVLTADTLDRCFGDYEVKDWVHKEIVTALNFNCNIIPIIDNFSWPENETLPEDIRSISRFNAITWIHDYQDACIDKLERFLRLETKKEYFGSFSTIDNSIYSNSLQDLTDKKDTTAEDGKISNNQNISMTSRTFDNCETSMSIRSDSDGDIERLFIDNFYKKCDQEIVLSHDNNAEFLC